MRSFKPGHVDTPAIVVDPAVYHISRPVPPFLEEKSC